MRVSATYRPPYGPKCRSRSGTFGSTNELLESCVLLKTGTRFHAAADIDTVGMASANGVTDVFDAQTTRQKRFLGIESVEPFPGKSGTRSAITRRPRIQQIEIRWKLLHPFQ